MVDYMVDYQKIAKQYANQGCDIVQPTSAERNGYRYFYLDRSDRPRYTGHPYIIKISPVGKVQQVLDLDNIYWARNQRITNGEQSFEQK
jgi:hypothetical protein